MRGVTATVKNTWKNCTFLLTRPMRGVTDDARASTIALLFLLTRPMRGVTRHAIGSHDPVAISTHTPHAGRDPVNFHMLRLPLYFYSHAPCGA